MFYIVVDNDGYIKIRIGRYEFTAYALTGLDYSYCWVYLFDWKQNKFIFDTQRRY